MAADTDIPIPVRTPRVAQLTPDDAEDARNFRIVAVQFCAELARIKAMIEDDVWASPYQSVAHYRQALRVEISRGIDI